MIHNNEELGVARSQLDNLQDGQDKIKNSLNKGELNDQLIALSLDALQFQINKLSEKIREYEELLSNGFSVQRINSIQTLRPTLIKERISQHVSQEQMAKYLNLDLATFKRLEASYFDGASFQLLRSIASHLDTPYDPKIFANKFDFSSDTVSRIPVAEMKKRGWLEGLVSNDPIRAFFENSGVETIDKVLNRQIFRQNAKINDAALAAWYARVNQLASYDRNLPNYLPDKLSEEFLKQLREVSVATDGPAQAIFKLRSIGIIVVVEPHLEGTHIDGAAFFIDRIRPVIALTLRYDRIDNFWFVLFHELAHIKMHLWGDDNIIFDDLDMAPGDNLIERQADEFASNNLIPKSKWDNALFLIKPSPIGIEKYAAQLKIHPAIVAGRIRRESGNYSKFSDMIGNGLVRKLLLPGYE